METTSVLAICNEYVNKFQFIITGNPLVQIQVVSARCWVLTGVWICTGIQLWCFPRDSADIVLLEVGVECTCMLEGLLYLGGPHPAVGVLSP